MDWNRLMQEKDRGMNESFDKNALPTLERDAKTADQPTVAVLSMALMVLAQQGKTVHIRNAARTQLLVIMDRMHNEFKCDVGSSVPFDKARQSLLEQFEPESKPEQDAA